jgi:hypothetical protein
LFEETVVHLQLFCIPAFLLAACWRPVAIVDQADDLPGTAMLALNDEHRLLLDRINVLASMVGSPDDSFRFVLAVNARTA